MSIIRTCNNLGQIDITREVLKYIAIGTMTLNHIAHAILIPGTFLYEFFIDTGYFTAITMCYLLVEGFFHTSSRQRYFIRLLIFSIVSEFPYCLLFSDGKITTFAGMNMIFTLMLCFLILMVFDAKILPLLKIILFIVLTALSIISDWALIAPLYTLCFYWAYGDDERRKKSFAFAIPAFALLHFDAGLDRYGFVENLERTILATISPTFAAFLICIFYKGRKSEKIRTFSKWFFYIYYPAHLLVLGLLRISLL